jgi:malate dehydrogenase (oxaloacetate-decarboxylating)(NADP+)
MSSTFAPAETRSEFPTGVQLLHDPVLNKGTGFTLEERRTFRLEGLLPPRVCSIEEQEARVLENYRKQPTDLAKYIYLLALQDRNETLYYRTVIDNIEEMMPIVYTPTVGQACQEYGNIFQRPRGLFISRYDRGKIVSLLRNWPRADVRMIVVTDGERILGLGDQGASGMGIPVGKLALYTVCAGVEPTHCLPITLDVGTNNEGFLGAPLYLGIHERRLRGPEYDALLEEFVLAAQEVFPRALIQFEDFANANAFPLLERYRNRVCCFNDDIQGTASVTLAGLLTALRITGGTLPDQRIVFLGAGEAGIGVADLVVSALAGEGVPAEKAKGNFWFLDSKGLMTTGREDLIERKRRYAQDLPFTADLAEVIRRVRPTAIIGVSGKPKMFTREVLQLMGELNERPIIFSLSNPTSKTECTAEDAYLWTEGRAVFASGSPFKPVSYQGKTFVPGQGNNAYIFPGVGLSSIAFGMKRVTDEMFFAAAQTLASLVSEEDLKKGSIFPPLTSIREVSAHIAAAVGEIAYRKDLATVPRPYDLYAFVKAVMYSPNYRNYM